MLQNFGEPLKARLPPALIPFARLACAKPRVSQRDAGTTVERFQLITHHSWTPRRADAIGMDQLARWHNFNVLAVERIRRTPKYPRCTPLTADAEVASPFGCVKNARSDPPPDDFVRGQRAEYALGGCGDSGVAENESIREIGSDLDIAF